MEHFGKGTRFKNYGTFGKKQTFQNIFGKMWKIKFPHKSWNERRNKVFKTNMETFSGKNETIKNTWNI